MLGLIIKDLCILKKQICIMAVIIVFYLICGILQDNPSFVFVFLMVFSALLPLTVMAYDEKNHCDKLFLCMPINRRQIITSRYILTIFLLMVSLIIGLAVSFVSRKDLMENVVTLLILVGLCLIYFSICFPFTVKFGVEKSRYIMMGMILLPTLLLSFLAKSKNIEVFFRYFDAVSPVMLVSFSLIVGLLFYIISLMLSIHMYQKKQL